MNIVYSVGVIFIDQQFGVMFTFSLFYFFLGGGDPLIR